MRTKPRLRPVAFSVLFVAGAVLGTLWDQFHVLSETLTYEHPTLAGQPWWVPLEFGLAFCIGIFFVTAAGDPAPRSDSPRLALTEFVWVSAIYSMTAFLSEHPWVLTGLLAGLLVARIGDFAVLAKANPIPAVTLVILGPLTEAMLIEAGLFRYSTSQLAGIPAWLPLLWAHVFGFIVRLAEASLTRWGLRRGPEPATAVVEGKN